MLFHRYIFLSCLLVYRMLCGNTIVFGVREFIFGLQLKFFAAAKGPFINYVTHLGGSGYEFVLRFVTERRGVLTKMLCNAKM